MQAKDFCEKSPGRIVNTVNDCPAFIPHPLPPAIDFTHELAAELSLADRSIGKLAMIAESGFYEINPHLIIRPFLSREAVLSSQIEGTQATISDLFLFEEAETSEKNAPDVREVGNYVRALEYGLEQVKQRPLGLPLIREMHQILMEKVRGGDKTPGTFRNIQVFLGRNKNIGDARYVPPPPIEVMPLMQDLERYMLSASRLPPLIRHALIHYQFETIHPFQDGNGRIGRLLITLLLCADKVVELPMLYLSAYFERNRQEYYQRLLEVSQKNAWQEWILYYLRGVTDQAKDAVNRSRRLMEFRKYCQQRLQSKRKSALAIRLVDFVFSRPTITVPRAAKLLGVTQRSAQINIDSLIQIGLLSEVTGQERNRIYMAKPIIELLKNENTEQMPLMK